MPSGGVLGGIQPDKLNDCFKNTPDGIHARLLWSWPAKVPYQPLPNTIEEVDFGITAPHDQVSPALAIATNTLAAVAKRRRAVV
jgi:hypothetical protein